nr:MAG TPA: hypothetical protein [Caudoviricetes sp.]
MRMTTERNTFVISTATMHIILQRITAEDMAIRFQLGRQTDTLIISKQIRQGAMPIVLKPIQSAGEKPLALFRGIGRFLFGFGKRRQLCMA